MSEIRFDLHRDDLMQSASESDVLSLPLAVRVNAEGTFLEDGRTGVVTYLQYIKRDVQTSWNNDEVKSKNAKRGGGRAALGEKKL